MPKLPRLSAREIRAVLEKIGFSLTRQSGSQIFKSAAGKRATVPFHASRILHPKVLNSILRDAELSLEDLEKATALIRGETAGDSLGFIRREAWPRRLARDQLKGSGMP